MYRKVFDDDGYLDLREPEEVTNAGRRGVRSMMTAVGAPMIRLVELQQAELEALNLPDGQKVTDEQIAEAMGKAAANLNADEATYDKLQQVGDAALVAAIAGWSLPQPVTRETLDNLPVTIYDKVVAAGKDAGAAVMAKLSVDFSIKDPDPRTGAEDPTGA